MRIAKVDSVAQNGKANLGTVANTPTTQRFPPLTSYTDAMLVHVTQPNNHAHVRLVRPQNSR